MKPYPESLKNKHTRLSPKKKKKNSFLQPKKKKKTFLSFIFEMAKHFS